MNPNILIEHFSEANYVFNFGSFWVQKLFLYFPI
jgi:hypothetical protein